jgi:hypothetical protein
MFRAIRVRAVSGRSRRIDATNGYGRVCVPDGYSLTRRLHVLVLLAAVTAACGGEGSNSPTSPTLNTLLASPFGAGASMVSGPRAIGPELPAQNCSQERSLRSTDDAVRTDVEFVNVSGSSKRLYWLTYTGERELFNTLPNGWYQVVHTYLTHPWVVADEAGTCIAIYATSAQPSTVTIRDAAPPLSAALIASSLAAEINRSFIAAMQSADVPAYAQKRAGVASCSGGGSVRVQHLGPAPGGGRVTLANTSTIFSGCVHTSNGRGVVANGTLVANGGWTASEPTSPVHLFGDLAIDGLGAITIDGSTGAYFAGTVGGITQGAPDTPPPPNPPSTGIAKYDGTYDFLWRYPTGNGTSSSQTVRRFWVVRNGAISSTDGSISGSVDGSGGVRFTFPCPINSSIADFSGNLDWTAQPGFNRGEGTYVCRMPISGSLTWQVTQSR